eukprot:gb/GFBE01060798.1/.p1 GENE.gb/GFBE01060798.1/~~gb/GFBE01060798.1/.p1  ORF type:complete len:362 (+),score=54.87 gb/GFBE01060798.1/:1-1086(+)
MQRGSRNSRRRNSAGSTSKCEGTQKMPPSVENYANAVMMLEGYHPNSDEIGLVRPNTFACGPTFGEVGTSTTASSASCSRSWTSESLSSVSTPPVSLEELVELNRSIETAGDSAQTWRPACFKFIKTIQQAGRNYGVVDLMQLIGDGSFVAVKRMPKAWVGSGHQENICMHPHECERPWVDIGLVKYLNMKCVPFVCEPRGIFEDGQMMLSVSDFATEGDFFQFVTGGPTPGEVREAVLRPFMKQIFSAVQWMHDHWIAHCDLSLENILVTKDPHTDTLKIKLIDFSMATVGQTLACGFRAKPSYQAPEMHAAPAYDPFQLDMFALGVVLFSSAATVYPWNSTVPGACKCFARPSRAHSLR